MTSDQRAADLAANGIQWGVTPDVRQIAKGGDVEALRDLFVEETKRAGWADNAGQLAIRDGAARIAAGYLYKMLWPHGDMFAVRAFVAASIERESIRAYHDDEAAAGLL
jgi:hypothetical protein